MKYKKKYVRYIAIICLFILYLLYSQFISTIFPNNILYIFLADLLYFFIVVIFFKKNIIKSLKEIRKKYKVKDIFKVVLIWVVVLFVFNIICGYITDLISSAAGSSIDDNTAAIDVLYHSSKMYAIFKIMIFSVVVEELLFKEAIFEIFKKPILFVIVSSLIYAIFNFVFTDFVDGYLVLSFITYALFGAFTDLAYLKNKNNIVIVMIIKFVYQLIPLTLMLISL